jgi:hypothetical protein
MFFAEHELPRKVKEHVAELLPDRGRIVFGERMIELEHLLDQIGPQRLAGLDAVPRASDAKVAHDRQRALKR